MSELPQGWATASLGDLCKIARGGSPRPIKEYLTNDQNGINWVKIGDATASTKYIFETREKIRPEGLKKSRLVKDGDFLLSNSMSFGRPYIMRTTGCIHDGWLVLRDRAETFDQDYLYHFLGSASAYQQFDRLAAGTTVRNLNSDLVKDVEVLLPPMAEQRRIAAKIDILTGKSKRARDHLDHIPRLVEKYRQAVLAAAFRGDLTREWRTERGLVTGYRASVLEEVLEDIRYGTAKKCDYNGGETPVLRIPNVQRGEVALDDLKSADFEPAELGKLGLRVGDILVIRSNGSLSLVGRSAIVNEAAAGMLFAGYLIRLRLDPRVVLPRYVHLWLQSGPMRAVIEGLAKSTSGVNNINSTQIEQLPIKLTSLDEQHEIIRRIEHAFQWIDRLASEATSARTLIDRLDLAVLAKAFRGELVPQDPADEPASVLLKRIKAECSATSKVKRRRKGKAA